jgi:hypothetical protein
LISLHHEFTGEIFDVLDTPNAKEITHAQLYAGYKGAGALKRGGFTSVDSRTRANISLSLSLSCAGACTTAGCFWGVERRFRLLMRTSHGHLQDQKKKNQLEAG